MRRWGYAARRSRWERRLGCGAVVVVVVVQRVVNKEQARL